MPNSINDRPEIVNLNMGFFDFGNGSPLSAEVAEGLQMILKREHTTYSYAGPMWGGFDANCTAEYSTIIEGSQEQNEFLIKQVFASNLAHGFLQGKIQHDRLVRSNEDRISMGSLILDKMVRLAEAVGAIRCPSPTHGQMPIDIRNPEGVFASIEKSLGVDLTAPDQDGGLYGIRLRGRIYSERHFDSIYTAWRLREIVGSDDLSKVKICEIGGGAGLCAYYSRKLGFKSYTIIDLPQAQLVQYLVLASSLGYHHVQHNEIHDDGITLIQAGTREAENLDPWDIVLNVDSMPEMRSDVAVRYLWQINRRHTFVSINQECGVTIGSHDQCVVRDLALECGLKRLSRYPSWMRAGYVEEVYVRT